MSRPDLSMLLLLVGAVWRGAASNLGQPLLQSRLQAQDSVSDDALPPAASFFLLPSSDPQPPAQVEYQHASVSADRNTRFWQEASAAQTTPPNNFLQQYPKMSDDEDQTSALVLERLAQMTNFQTKAVAQGVRENAQLLAVVSTLQEEVVSLRRGASNTAPPGTFEAGATPFPQEGITAVTTTLLASAILPNTEDTSKYSLVAIVAPLVLQALILSSVVSYVWHHKNWLKLDPLGEGIPILGGIFCLDIAWVVFCMTGVLDVYVKQALIIMFIVLLLVCNLCFVFYLVHKVLQKNALVQDFNEMNALVSSLGTGAVDVMAKIDAMYTHLHPNLPSGDAMQKFLLNKCDFDSEDENNVKAMKANKTYGKLPDENANKLPAIYITIVKAEGLVNADSPSLIPMGPLAGVMGAAPATGGSDPYVSVAMRGRKKACSKKTGCIPNNLNPTWEKDNHFTITDFKEGDVIKFKIWDDDSHEIQGGIPRDQLLGKAHMTSEQIVESINAGKDWPLKLTLGEKEMKRCKVKPGDDLGKLYVRIAYREKGRTRESVIMMEAEEALEGEEHMLKNMMKGRCC